VGVSETIENLSSTINVYPQPASDVIHLTSNRISLAKASIYTIDGRLAKVFSAQEVESGDLPIGELKTGVYFLSLTGTMGETVVKKVVLNNY
jgi:hypothetical protein